MAALAHDMMSILSPSGVGASGRFREQQFVVDFVQQGMDGELLGWRTGDRLLAIGGKPAAELGAAARERSRAARASPCCARAGIARSSWRPAGLPTCPSPQVSHDLLPGNIGYLRLPTFFAGATPQVIQALHALSARGATGLLLDLRGNGGGSIAEAVALCDLLLRRGSAIAFVEANAATFELRELGPHAVLPVARRVALSGLADRGPDRLLDRLGLRVPGRMPPTERASAARRRAHLRQGRRSGRRAVVTLREDLAWPFVQVLLITAFRLKQPDGRSINGVGLLPDVISRELAASRDAIQAVALLRTQPAFDDRFRRFLENDGEGVAALAGWRPGESLPHEVESLVQTFAGEARVAAVEFLRRLCRAHRLVTQGVDAADLSRDRVLRRALQVLAVHRGEDAESLDPLLPPLVERGPSSLAPALVSSPSYGQASALDSFTGREADGAGVREADPGPAVSPAESTPSPGDERPLRRGRSDRRPAARHFGWGTMRR